MRAYSKDLRLRVLAAVDRGMPREEIARVFGVSAPTVRRYLRLRRETGGVEGRLAWRKSEQGAVGPGGWIGQDVVIGVGGERRTSEWRAEGGK